MRLREEYGICTVLSTPVQEDRGHGLSPTLWNGNTPHVPTRGSQLPYATQTEPISARVHWTERISMLGLFNLILYLVSNDLVYNISTVYYYKRAIIIRDKYQESLSL